MPSKKPESLVVSGISGRFPECQNIKQFRERILAGDCLVTHDDARWPLGTYNLPTGSGKIRRLEDFDAEFFGFTDGQADFLDPLDRIMITEAYSAILDAGVLPETLRGTNTGCFFGSFADQVQSALKDEVDSKESAFQFHASRIHQALDLRGPACWMENGCATSLTALQIAVNSIQNGLCDQAIVGGVNIVMDPTRVNWQMLYETLSADSVCHVFDTAACGYVKGEAAVAIFVQKRSQAKRIYCDLLGVHVNHDGYKAIGFTHPGWKTQRDLMLAAMNKAGVNGTDYQYFEAHGTGTQAGDKTELRSIYEAICRDRSNETLMVGSIKSITGHAEGASGLVSLAKIIIAYQTKLMAPNLNYINPNPKIPRLTDGTFFVNTKAHPFEGGVCGINNFGIGGGNGSLVINSYDKQQIEQDFNICQPIPRLILTFGRNTNIVQETLNELESNIDKITREYCSLLNDISNISPSIGMKSRGFMILDHDKTPTVMETNDIFVGDKNERRPLWFVFNGIGSQWLSMGKRMMNVTPFANSICYSIKYLTSLGYDGNTLRNFIVNGISVPTELEPVFVSTVVVQIALLDTLTELGIQPDGIVGHSVGEVSAAYADGCITRDEALKIILTIEREVFKIRERTPGKMMAVGLSAENAEKYCFGTVDVACVNSAHMVTMAGNEQDMQTLAAVLRGQKIFVHPVETCGLTTHTKFLRTSFEPTFMQPFERITKARPRTNRFVSSSYEKENWNDKLCIKPDGQYFGRNMLNQVRFYDAIKTAPKHTLFIEIGPTSQLKSPIMQSFDAEHDIRYVEMMRRGFADNAALFLKSLGTLYANGHNIELNLLYPPVQYPVSRHTEFVSPILRYDHSKPRMVPKYPRFFSPSKTSRSTLEESISITTDPYVQDHAVDGMVLYPGTGYLYLAWKTIATYYGKDYMQFPVEFRKINISRATKLTDKETQLKCVYFADTGSFTIEANNNVCTSGFVFPLDPKFKFIQPTIPNLPEDVIQLDSESLYRELHVRGYHFGKNFQNILQIDEGSRHAVIRWTDNVITFLDAILQSSVLQQHLRLLYVPTLIEAMQVDPNAMKRQLRYCNKFEQQVSDVYIDQSSRLIHASGVQVLNACFKPIARKLEESVNAEIVVESQEAIGYDESNGIDLETQELIQNYLYDVDRLVQDFSNGKRAQLNENQLNSKNYGLMLSIDKQTVEAINAKQCSIIESLSTEFDCDILHSTITSDRFFRTQLDVVIENINLYMKFNVLEINTSCQLIYPKLVKVVTRPLFGFNMNNIEYTMAHSDPDRSLPEEIQNNTQIKTVEFEVEKSRFPYRDLEKQEFVIYRDPNISLSQIDRKVDYDLLLRSIETTLADNGFLLAFLRESIHPMEQLFSKHKPESFRLRVEQFVKFAEEAGLTYVGKKSDTFTCCSLLFRKVEKVEHNEKIIEILNDDLSWLEVLKDANRNNDITRIWIHSCEPQSGIVGLIRGLAKDISRNKIKYIYYDKNHISLEQTLNVARRTQLLQNTFIGKQLGSYRHITFSEMPETIDYANDFEMRQIKTGDLSSFRPFVKQPVCMLDYQSNDEHCELGPDAKGSSKILVDIHKAPLNFRDVMIASARMSPSDVTDHMAWDDVVLGLEFAGRIHSTGQRVMGFNNCKALSTSIIANKEFLWPVPDHWTLLQASTIPVVYATCYYGLIIRGKLREGETVLIHAGTGGVGLAAITICLAMKCRVITTAGTDEKREYLRKTYPQIEPECIGNSRDCSFYKMVMQQTGGKGVDLVLNSLTDDMFWASVRCLADNGRFCEIGKYQFMNDDLMDVNLLLRNKNFHGVHLDRLFPDGEHAKLLNPKAIRERKQTWHLVNEGIKSGVVQPLPSTVFGHESIESAFRFMSTGKHIGKVVVQFGQEDSEEKRLPIKVRAVPKSYFDPKKSYIIAGGLGGMGLELMFWMTERGAKNFVLTSRSGVKTPTHKFMIRMVTNSGCKVLVSTNDGGNDQGALKVVKEAESMGPIGGIFLSTLVLANESIDKITVPMYEKVMYAKSTQAVVFDRVLRKLSYPIDYFVGFSSIAAGRGFPVVGSFIRVEDNLSSTKVKISLIDHVCNIMGIKNKSKLDPKATLADLGLDSMMATEIGNVFENEFHVALTAKDIRAMTIEKITQGIS
ncbi:hypothetical protein RDWZM_000760 [Blomia tropicalis]|uniref:Fatty acid synthase n=1 Tax=Blomia tropicalis TaxID=40697 RepID=A0A9Q0MEN2_BLOTA|nr:hypothetical protein RDWZM_000760 [Blomia tropicalis]